MSINCPSKCCRKCLFVHITISSSGVPFSWFITGGLTYLQPEFKNLIWQKWQLFTCLWKQQVNTPVMHCHAVLLTCSFGLLYCPSFFFWFICMPSSLTSIQSCSCLMETVAPVLFWSRKVRMVCTLRAGGHWVCCSRTLQQWKCLNTGCKAIESW